MGATLELCPKGTSGTHGRVLNRERNWSAKRHCSLLLEGPPPLCQRPCRLRTPPPLVPGPTRHLAHRGSGFRPPRAPSAAPLPRRRRRHLPLAAVTLRTRRTRWVAGKWSPHSRPTLTPISSPVSSLPDYSGWLFLSGLRTPCLLGNIVPWQRLGPGRETETSGKWSSQWF